MDGPAESAKFWFNVATNEVEEGHKSSWQHLMGPYSTRAEAERALEQAASRTASWDAEDERDKQ